MIGHSLGGLVAVYLALAARAGAQPRPAVYVRWRLDCGPAHSPDLFGHDLADQPAIVGAQLRAMRAAEASTRLGALAGIPTLVLSAIHDPIAPPHAGKALAAGIPLAGVCFLATRGAIRTAEAAGGRRGVMAF